MKGIHALAVVAVIAAPSALAITPGSNWKDSYSVNGQCYCDSTYDHDADLLIIDTPAGPRSVIEVCDTIGPGPGAGTNPVYNDLQCGNGPPNSAPDETACPGRVDLGAEGCTLIGPTWNLEKYFPAPETDTVTGPSIDAPGTTTTDTGTSIDSSGTTTTDSGTVDAQPHILILLPEDQVHDFTRFSSKDDRWVVIDDRWLSQQTGDTTAIRAHLADSDSGNYLEVHPDTKMVDSDPTTADSVWGTAGDGPQIQFDLDFDRPGVYEVYIRMFSTNSFDDGMSVAVDGQWSDTTGIHHTCDTHGVWTWSPCASADAITVTVPTAGTHSIQFAAMDDGVEIDLFVFRKLADAELEPKLAKAVSVGQGVAFGTGISGFYSLALLMVSICMRRRSPARQT